MTCEVSKEGEWECNAANYNLMGMDSRISKGVNNKKKTMQDSKNKTRILVVDANAAVRKGLMQFVNDQAGFTVGFEAKSTSQALETIEEQQVDLAIVSTSEEGKTRPQPAEKMKLQYPNLPVLMLSTRGEELCVENTLGAGAKGGIVSQKASEQIIKAVRYAQALLRSGILGFTLLVEIERSLGER